jgi:hypothetical protein
VEASLGNQATLATRPHGQVDLSLVGAWFHGKPCERRVSSGAAPASSITRRTFSRLSSGRYGITTEWKTTVVTPGRESAR